MSVQHTTKLTSWCFTLNNPRPENDEVVRKLGRGEVENVKYFVAQMETGESGTPHWQGYI